MIGFVASEVVSAVMVQVGSYALRRAARKARRWPAEQAPYLRPGLGQMRLYSVPLTRVISATPDRARLAVAGVRGDPARAQEAERRLRELAGVLSVSVSALTGNALVHYDPRLTNLTQIRVALEAHRGSTRRRCTTRRGSSHGLQLAFAGL
jgi:hypothetical protein